MYGEPSLERLDEDSVLPYVAKQALLAIKELGPDVVLYGIHKKGASLLEDLASSYPYIGDHDIVFDTEDYADTVRGRVVLIIDDSIHRGKTCQEHVHNLKRAGASRVAIFVVVTSRKGLVEARKAHAPITSVVSPVPEELFTLAFGLLMVPALGLFRNGALSNRPHRSFRIDSGATEPQEAAVTCLRVLTRLDCLGPLREIPAVDGMKATVYHGSADASAATMRGLNRMLEPLGIVEQGKYRIFLTRANGAFHLCFCAIVWPIARADQKAHVVHRAADRAATWLLDRAESELQIRLAGSGFYLKRVSSRLQS